MSEEEKLQLENECLLKYSKAQMIQKYIDELEENCNLSDLWCKSQEENKRLNNIINNIENDLLDRYYGRGKYHLSTDIIGIPTFYRRIKELKGEDKE